MAYSKAALDKIISTLESWAEAANEALDRAEDSDNPNQDKIDRFSMRVEGLEAAIDDLNEIEE